MHVVAGTQKYAIEPAPLRSQTLKITVRVTPLQVEARLAAPLQCVRSGSAQFGGTEDARYRLSVTDSVIRWSAFGAAGAAAGLVIVGLARGQGLGRGAAVLGIWTVPLAALGAYETLRERDVTEPVTAATRTFKPRESACPPSKSVAMVRLVGAEGDSAKAELDLEWRRVALTRPAELQTGESILPTVLGGDGLPVAQLLRKTGPKPK